MRGTNFDILEKIRKIYDSGANIIEYINTLSQTDQNAEEAILISYEFQAGSYSKAYCENSEPQDLYSRSLAAEISRYYSFAITGGGQICTAKTLLEVGIGEGTTSLGVMQALSVADTACFGFDLSWSRTREARRFLSQHSFPNVHLNTGNLFRTPYVDNAFDVVYTSHSLEPNGGREEEGLRELYRITGKYLFLFEPGYELAGAEARARMEKHGYVKNLYSTAKSLGYRVVEHKLLGCNACSPNPTSVFVIEKNGDIHSGTPYCCPLTRVPLSRHDNVMYAGESGLMYPIIHDIPCLLPENAIPGIAFDR